MKIFSNFNTRFAEKILEENLQIFKKQDVFVVHRSKFYVLFYILPQLILYIIILLFWFFIFLQIEFHYLVYIVYFLLWLPIFWFRVVYKIFKYICDFTIVTPWGITTYKQKWILHSVLKEIPAKRIKSVEIFRPSLLWNIFGYGTVDVISDMNESNNLDVDNEWPWIVWLTYVDSPHRIKSKISEICFK